jgi:hypothetical protein
MMDTARSTSGGAAAARLLAVGLNPLGAAAIREASV